MMQDSKLAKEPAQNRDQLGYKIEPNDEKIRKRKSLSSKGLRVRFLLPDNDQNKEVVTLYTLPSVCEFTMFSSNQPAAKPKKQVNQNQTKFPAVNRNTKGNVEGAATKEIPSSRKLSTGKNLVIKCAKQDIQMEVKSKLPKDYRNPTPKETRKRIWDWLSESAEYRPTYVCRGNALSNNAQAKGTSTTRSINQNMAYASILDNGKAGTLQSKLNPV